MFQLNCIQSVVVNGVDWMQAAQDRDICGTVVGTIRKLLFLKTGEFLDYTRVC
jgi:hypothetical protein